MGRRRMEGGGGGARARGGGGGGGGAGPGGRGGLGLRARVLGPLLGPVLGLAAAALPVKDVLTFLVSAVLFCPVYLGSPARAYRKLCEGCVVFWVFTFVSGAPFMYAGFFWALIFGPLWLNALALLYGGYIYFDRRPYLPDLAPGAHPVRRWASLRHFRAYFPCRLQATCALDPARKYVFGYHPHGILSLGVVGNFVTEQGFGAVFPGVNVHPLTLKSNFAVPLWRELALGMGLRDSGRATCDAILRGGGSICLVVGGAAEAIETTPGGIGLTLAQRKGFVRVALANGADLVPCITFGESEAFRVLRAAPGTLLHDVSAGMKAFFGFAIPVFFGHGPALPPGLRWLSIGLLPLPRKITTVVGEPVEIKRPFEGDLRSGEGAELVDKYHRRYLKALRKLYDDHKEVHFADRQRTLKFNDAAGDPGFPRFDESGGGPGAPRGVAEVEELLKSL